jgi:hypothetical protein
MADSVRQRVDVHASNYRWHRNREYGRTWITVDGHEISGICSDSLHDYLNLSMSDILRSENPSIRAIGMLDCRLGKHRLANLEMSAEHDLVKRMHTIRCEGEQIRLPQDQRHLDVTSRLGPPSSRKRHRKERKARMRVATEAGAEVLAHSRQRRLRSLITGIHRAEIPKEETDNRIVNLLRDGFAHSKDPDVLFHFLLTVESRSKLLRSTSLLRGVLALADDSGHWLRQPEDWTPTSHNPTRQFASLARHLWARFPVPLFMDRAWIGGTAVQQQWFKHLGEGKNLCSAPNLPLALTRKMAHHFLQAPDTYPIEAAFRWGQVHALGGDARLANTLLETRLIREFGDDPFWLSVLRFFIANPMLDPTHVAPIIDYIWNQRFEPQIVFVAPGVAQERGPAHPHFSMKGRTVDALLRAVDAWHVRLGRKRQDGEWQWKKSTIQDFVYVEGSKASHNMKIWRIQELLSTQELIAEGRELHHCVASYARSCHNGQCAIWTMSVQTEERTEKILTIEVDNQTREIRQVRGKFNRLPTEREKHVIERWVSKERLEPGAPI